MLVLLAPIRSTSMDRCVTCVSTRKMFLERKVTPQNVGLLLSRRSTLAGKGLIRWKQRCLKGTPEYGNGERLHMMPYSIPGWLSFVDGYEGQTKSRLLRPQGAQCQT
jgi:hypothetical protein